MNQTRKNHQIILVLDNIRSCHNVGSVFRTSDSFGVSKIILGGITPGPIDKYGRKRSDITKVALGAEDTIPYECVADLATYLKKQKQEEPEIRIISLEQAENSVSLYDLFFPVVSNDSITGPISEFVEGLQKIILVVGNEVDGVSKEVLALSDLVVEIPQMGEKESLNVSVATGIALFAFRSLDNVQ